MLIHETARLQDTEELAYGQGECYKIAVDPRYAAHGAGNNEHLVVSEPSLE